MLKKKYFCMVALASAMLATSCSGDDSLGAFETSKGNAILMTASVGHNVTSRALETTTANLTEFFAYSFKDGEANYMDKVKYTLGGSDWGTDQGTFFWPVTGDLNFYCYSPETPGTAGTFTINKDQQELTDFTPNSAAADQKDFIYAKATGNKDNVGGIVNINFEHALSEVTVAAKNDNEAYTIKVSGVRLGNIKNKGTFTFSPAAWSTSSETQNYETTWSNDVQLGSDASNLDAANVPFMLIPQQLGENYKAVDGSYIALKVKVIMNGGQYLRGNSDEGDWVYIPVSTNWEMGKRYAYTLDFTSGAGQDENGNQIISGTGIKMNVTVTDWTPQSENVTVQ